MKALSWLRSSNWKPLFHNVEIQGVQVDIVARDPGGLLHLIEVKSNTYVMHLSGAQKRRLFRVAALLAEYERVELGLAVPAGKGFHLIPVDALTD